MINNNQPTNKINKDLKTMPHFLSGLIRRKKTNYRAENAKRKDVSGLEFLSLKLENKGTKTKRTTTIKLEVNTLKIFFS